MAAPNILSRIRARLASNPKMLSTFEEKVLPIRNEVRAEMAGKPENEVYAELIKRLNAAGVEHAKFDDKIHLAAERISKLPPA